MRRIDADALKAEWYKINDIGPEDCGARFVGYQEIARLIDNAPTVEPGGDYISRADAIEELMKLPTDTIHSHFDDGYSLGVEHAIAHIKVLPSAELTLQTPQTYGKSINPSNAEVVSADAVHGWIPCSERLPSEDGSYIVTSSFGKVSTAHYYSERGHWQHNRRGLIEAWMPLPTPYKGGDTE